MSYRVRPGRAADAALLGGLESAAAKRFASIGLPQIAGGRPTSEADYLALAAETRLWVTEEDGGELVGLAIADRVDDEGYLAEISVHPDHGGRRLAPVMIAEVEAWAREQGFASVSLITFRDVPWNRPYYERLGFVVLDEAAAGPELRAIRNKERARGLDNVSPRVCMRKLLKLKG